MYIYIIYILYINRSISQRLLQQHSLKNTFQIPHPHSQGSPLAVSSQNLRRPPRGASGYLGMSWGGGFQVNLFCKNEYLSSFALFKSIMEEGRGWPIENWGWQFWHNSCNKKTLTLASQIQTDLAGSSFFVGKVDPGNSVKIRKTPDSIRGWMGKKPEGDFYWIFMFSDVFLTREMDMYRYRLVALHNHLDNGFYLLQNSLAKFDAQFSKKKQIRSEFIQFRAFNTKEEKKTSHFQYQKREQKTTELQISIWGIFRGFSGHPAGNSLRMMSSTWPDCLITEGKSPIDWASKKLRWWTDQLRMGVQGGWS